VHDLDTQTFRPSIDWSRDSPSFTFGWSGEFTSADAFARLVPSTGSDSDDFDDYMRFCIAREDDVLESALGKIRQAISG